jgi:hypothetical protein
MVFARLVGESADAIKLRQSGENSVMSAVITFMRCWTNAKSNPCEMQNLAGAACKTQMIRHWRFENGL